MCTKLFLTLHIMAIWMSGAIPTKPCVTLDGQKGNCVPVEKCTWNLTETANESNIVQRSECESSESLTPLVCCHQWKNSQKCGQIRNNTEELEINKFPWVVDVLYMRRGRSTLFKCTGSLISEEYVLTAGHCVKDMPFRLKPSRIRVRQGVKYKDYEIQSSIVHPEYSTDRFNKINDVAILKLVSKIEFSELVQPICLPSESALQASVSQGQTVSIFSKGPTKVDSPRLSKRLISMQVRDSDLCNNYYRDMLLELNKDQLCVGGEIGRDACPGDSGGPLMFPEPLQYQSDGDVSDQRWFQVGTVSLGPQRCGSKIPGIYVNLLKYIDWIKATISTN